MKDVWGALSDVTRREILTLLDSRPHTAGEIADQFELCAATVSHHLSVLKESGLVLSHKRAQTIIYSLNAGAMREVTNYVLKFARK